MSRLYVFPSNFTLSTPAYTVSTACCNVEAYAVTAKTRPPEVTISSPDFEVPAWKTATSFAKIKLSLWWESITHLRLFRRHVFFCPSHSFQGSLVRPGPPTQHTPVDKRLRQNQDGVLRRPSTSR